MSQILLGILNETLEDIVRQMKGDEVTIEKWRGEIENSRKAVQSIETQQKCTVYDDKQAIEKLEVLKSYLDRLEKHPLVLMRKMEKLSEERRRTKQAREQAGERMSRAYDDQRRKETQLKVIEEEYTELQKQYRELSELITQEQTNAVI